MFHQPIRKCLLALCAAAAVLGSFTAVRADDDDWKRYLGDILDRRSRSESRYRDWDRGRREYYEQHRHPDEFKGGGVIELDDSSVPAGRYGLNLGGLNFSVNVRDPGSPGRGALGDVHRITSRMEQPLQDMHVWLHQRGVIDRFQPQMNEAREFIDSMIEHSEDDDVTYEQLQQLYVGFDERWHQLTYRLQSIEMDGYMAGLFNSVQQNDEMLHQILQVAQGPVYDRPQVVALTQHLATTTARLADEVDWDALNVRGAERIRRQIERVAGLAEDLHYAAADNRGFTAVLQEYQEFDTAWHRLEEFARNSDDLGRRVQGFIREIWSIDQQLHQQLMIDPPVYNSLQRLTHLSARVVESAEHLVQELRYEFGRREGRELSRSAQDFASAARVLHDDFAESRQLDQIQRSLDNATVTWQRLEQDLQRLERERYRHSWDVAEQLRTDVDRLTAELRTYAESIPPAPN